ncbi:glycosyltransferase family 2 protein [Caulobacter sp. 17J65-9]|uniref:glycosyltransferase family 2 protein n=1 Tax=Caulobacter sp. 17J65-9 TaxID=2709382 RepID=UPI00196A025D|nr:glycosyltransferase family 2 protein [Caulobacter sp. 17J65-9]
MATLAMPARATAAATVELTVLMPCLNEAETIETCVRKARRFLERAGVVGEVLVADNGSTDGSQALAEANGARVVQIGERGYGAALMGGVRAARGRYVIMGDADDSYDFERLDPLLERLRQGFELVMGNRFKGGIKPGAMPFLHRWLGNPVLSLLGRLFFNIPIGDFHCGLRGFSRESLLALNLHCPGMEFASEMVVKSAVNGLRIAEAPTTLSPDGRSRAPHLKTWRDGWRHLRFLLLHSPKWLFLIPGAALIAFGLLGMVVLAPGPLALAPHLVLDVRTLVVACFALVTGTQLMVFSALGRRYAMNEGFMPPANTFRPLLAALTLERMLLGAGLVLALGCAGTAWAIGAWAASDFGPLISGGLTRLLLVSLTAVAVALEVGASAFLASMFTLRR